MKNLNYVFVDLDGTLIRTDLFFESFIRLIKTNILYVFAFLLQLAKSRSHAKNWLAGRVDIDAASLPYNENLLKHLAALKHDGTQLVLATASNARYAHQVADHLGIFDSVLASSVDRNLKGTEKLRAIRELVDEGEAYCYAGDSHADRPIWDDADAAIFVDAPSSEIRRAQAAGKPTTVITSGKPLHMAFLREMRLHQWVKNALIFVPMLASHSYTDGTAWLLTIAAFIAYSLCASGVYFLNDLLDLDSDRRHHRKRKRPLASGDLPIVYGLIGSIGMPLIAFAIAVVYLPIAFGIILAIYLITTIAYSFFIKSVSTADVITLSLLYTLRVVAGAMAIGVALSSWLLLFSVFIFTSLAYLKRYVEVSSLNEDSTTAPGRGYSSADQETMFSLGISTMTAAVLVLAMYVNSSEIRALYETPDLLWGLCVLILYWGNRIWIGARRGKIVDDPVVFAVKDKVSRLTGLLVLVTFVAAKFSYI